MEAVLRRQKQGTGHPPREVPAIAGTGSGRYRRRTFIQDITSQLQRTLRRLHQLSAWRIVPAISRLSDRRFHRRSQIQ